MAMYRVDKSWDGSHHVRRTSADEEIGTAVGSAIGWAAGAGFDGLGKLARQTQDRKMIRLAQDINAAEEAEDFGRLLALSTECVRRYPSQEYGHAQLALALSHAGRTDEAFAELDRAVGLGMDESEARLNRGQFLFDAGRLGPAIQEFSAVVNHPDYRLMALLGRVFCLCGLEDYDQALADADAAVAISPDALTYSVRGGVQQRRNELDLSLADFNRSIRLDPDDLEVVQMRASVYEDLGRTEEAEAERVALEARAAEVDGTSSSPLLSADPLPSETRTVAVPSSSTTPSIGPAVPALLGAVLLMIGLASGSGGSVTVGILLILGCLIWIFARRAG